MDKAFLEGFGLPEEAVQAILDAHDRELGDQAFAYRLDGAIAVAHGRNGTAIRALLDLDALRQSEEPEQAISQALEELRGECGYLFEAAPPPFAAGAGQSPLDKRYTLEQLGKMTMEQYKAYRQGR